jgi:hypothetical protein
MSRIIESSPDALAASCSAYPSQRAARRNTDQQLVVDESIVGDLRVRPQVLAHRCLRTVALNTSIAILGHLRFIQ